MWDSIKLKNDSCLAQKIAELKEDRMEKVMGFPEMLPSVRAGTEEVDVVGESGLRVVRTDLAVGERGKRVKGGGE